MSNIASFRASNITKRIPKYKNVKIKDVDLGDRAFYSGKYTGYSDDELEEIIDTELFYRNDNPLRSWSDSDLMVHMDEKIESNLES